MLTAMTEEDWTIVLRVFVASRSHAATGPERPKVSRSPALFCGSYYHLVGSSREIRALEQRVEAVLAAEPIWNFEAFFDALAAMSETADLVEMLIPPWCAPMSGQRAEKGAG